MNDVMFQDKLASCKSLLEIQTVSMTNILEKRLVLERVDQIIKVNPSLQTNNLFWEWFFTNYIDGQVMEIMRILDQDGGSKNLFRLLDSLLAGQALDNTFFTRIRDSHLSNTTLPKEMVYGLVPLLDTATIEADKKIFLDKVATIKAYRDSVIAHSDPQKRAKLNLTLPQINEIIELLHKRILHYVLCLTGSGYPASGLLPSITYDWESIFRIRWIN